MFTQEALDSTERSLNRLRSGLRPATGTITTGDAADALRQAAEDARADFIRVMDDDFNTSAALAAIFELVRAINTARAANISGPFFEAAQRTLRELAGVLGLALEGGATEGATNAVAAKPFIDLLVSVRNDLRAAKQWALADKIRDQLGELGITLEDSRDGTTWSYTE